MADDKTKTEHTLRAAVKKVGPAASGVAKQLGKSL